ncbi:MAG: hypothetical protein U0J70_03545, partial [Atopobiaceae bacterium]|nr:hypothetical protein [Atopobiaceae bacterium]
MKRALSALLALAMACSLVPTPALAEMAEEATTASNENAIVLDGQAAAADAGAGIGEQATEDKDPSVEAGTGRQIAAEDKDADENGRALVNDEEPDADGQVAAANVAEDKGANADDPLLGAQSDLSGSFVDEASGATWYVRWYEEVGLAITAVTLAEGEGPIDLVVPSGPVVYTTDDGGQSEGTIAAVADAFYHWGGTNEARERVRSVTIPNTITHIYGRMFGLHMPNLKTVTFEPA